MLHSKVELLKILNYAKMFCNDKRSSLLYFSISVYVKPFESLASGWFFKKRKILSVERGWFQCYEKI